MECVFNAATTRTAQEYACEVIKMGSSRVKNTFRNIIFSYLEMILSAIFTLLSRWLIVYFFNEKYLGLSSLFSSVIQILSVAELGFSSAILYNMYKPIAQNDVEGVCAILAYFRKVYRVVGVSILTLGLCIMPFIPCVIKGEVPNDLNIYFLYLLFLINTSIGYFFFAYKSALLEVLQRMDLIKMSNSFINILKYSLQLIVLLFFKNYYLFIGIQILCTVGNNLTVAWVAKKFFPQYQCRGVISENIKKDIIYRVKGLLISNISAVTYTSFDSIILSAFVGLDAVAIYGNYLVVCNMISKLVVQIRKSMQSSVGNSIASETVQKNYKDMKTVQLVFSGIATWCFVCLLHMYQPFMYIWMGQDRMLDDFSVRLLCLWFFVSVVQHAFYLYLSGNGLWWEMRMPYIFSTIINIIMNIVLGRMFGISGIILSTLFVSLCFGSIWQCRILFKKYYETSMKDYAFKQLKYFIICMMASVLAWTGCNYVSFELNYIGLVIRLVICTVSSVAIMFLFYRNTDEFKRAVWIVRRIFLKK